MLKLSNKGELLYYDKDKFKGHIILDRDVKVGIQLKNENVFYVTARDLKNKDANKMKTYEFEDMEGNG